MSQLPLTNVIEISVSAAQTGAGNYNVNNLGLFSNETAGSTFGTLGYQIYLDPTQVGVDFGTSSVTYGMANAVFSQQPNILAGGGYLTVITLGSAETIAAAVARTEGLVQYFGVAATEIQGSAALLATAAVIQPLNKIQFAVSRTAADVAPGGLLDVVRTSDFTQTRCLYYGGSTDVLALTVLASYAGRALSTNFDGSDTTQTMHLKDLTGVDADPSMTQTLLNQCVAAGADTYVSLQGVSKVFTSGANDFYDQVYNLQWLVGALQIAGFNYLAESSTKVPQTEQGMTGLKGAYRAVMQQAVANQYLAPGQWNSSTTFGNQTDFLTNILNLGYYIYSSPVSQQSQADRAARQAPLVQVSCKEAGAIQSSDLVIYVNP